MLLLFKSKRARIVWVGSWPISAAYLHTFTAFIVFIASNALLEIFPLSCPHTQVCHFKEYLLDCERTNISPSQQSGGKSKANAVLLKNRVEQN